MKKKPNFLIIGAAKSGTTTLHAMLKKHPDIFLAEEKDFKFFDVDDNYKKGWNWYEHYFKKHTDQKIIGEANSEYLFSKKAAERIKKDFGEEVKLLAIIRSPVERSFSEFLHQQRYGQANKSLEHYIKRKNQEFDQEGNDLYETIIERSLYSKHLANYFDVFSKEKIKVVILEKMKNNPKKEINEICSFLGINEMNIEELVTANKAYSPKVKWLNNLVLQPNVYRKLFKVLIPSFTVRQKIRDALRILNSNKIKKNQRITSAQREILENIFCGEKERLEKMLAISLKEWV